MKDLEKMRAKAAKLQAPTPVELPSGSWRCQVMVGGERISVVEEDPVLAHTKALAIKAGLIEKAETVEAITVGTAIDRYIESKDAVLSPATVAGYRRIRAHAFPELMPVRLRQLTQEAVQRAVNRMAKDKSPKSVRNAHGLLSAVLSVYRPGLHLRTTLPQKRRYEASVPDLDELPAILAAVRGTRVELPVLLALCLGLRASEIRGITWDAIEGEVLHIRSAIVEGPDGPTEKGTKTTAGDRRLPLPKPILELIQQQPHTDEHVIHMSGQAMYKLFSRTLEKAGLPHYRFHDLRHANASIMLALGIPDKYAQERMGHATDNMLQQVYQHTLHSQRAKIDEKVDAYFTKVLLHTDLHTEE